MNIVGDLDTLKRPVGISMDVHKSSRLVPPSVIFSMVVEMVVNLEVGGLVLIQWLAHNSQVPRL